MSRYRGKALVKLFAKALKAVGLLLKPTLARADQIVRRDAISPGGESRLATETSQVGDDSYENLLRRIAGVLRMPKHPEGQSINLILDSGDDILQRKLAARLSLADGFFD